MAQLHDFFTYHIIHQQPTGVEAKLELNASHELYEGHFPGNPVVPGVCQLHMIKKIVADSLKCKVVLSEARDIKFLAMIQPGKMRDLNCEIDLQVLDEERMRITALLSHQETRCMRLRGVIKLEKEL